MSMQRYSRTLALRLIQQSRWVAPSAMVCATLALAVPHPASAQAWPTKPIRLVATFSPGGGADLTGRIVGARLSELWKQPVVVENRTGAGGSLGAELVSRATPDGYTLLVVGASHTVNAALLQNLSFDLTRDFKPVALAASAPIVVVVHPRVKASTLQEFTGLLRAQPDKLDYASCGMASAHHFTMETFKYDTKTAALHIPHSCAGAVANVVGGQLDIAAVTLATALPFVQQGKLRAIALSSQNRSPLAPEIPTFRDSGVPELKNFAFENYYGFLAPSATPAAVVSKIEGDIRLVLQEPELQKRMAASGLDPFFRSAAETLKLLRTDIERNRRIASVANIKPE
ncbi:MAG: tripartite tricarboxylate transporter substrate binding protein [Proteobacteria bacterium]|nr:tripartite tricarboxylate transporter substrate binding protein [Burkholderiales bacterium]